MGGVLEECRWDERRPALADDAKFRLALLDGFLEEDDEIGAKIRHRRAIGTLHAGETFEVGLVESGHPPLFPVAATPASPFPQRGRRRRRRRGYIDNSLEIHRHDHVEKVWAAAKQSRTIRGG